jgi:hypothetical protein
MLFTLATLFEKIVPPARGVKPPPWVDQSDHSKRQRAVRPAEFAKSWLIATRWRSMKLDVPPNGPVGPWVHVEIRRIARPVVLDEADPARDVILLDPAGHADDVGRVVRRAARRLAPVVVAQRRVDDRPAVEAVVVDARQARVEARFGDEPRARAVDRQRVGFVGRVRCRSGAVGHEAAVLARHRQRVGAEVRLRRGELVAGDVALVLAARREVVEPELVYHSDANTE